MVERFGFSRIGFWILILVAFNFGAFIVYKGAYPRGDIFVQGWGYLETDTFKVITISLFLPIILLAFESRFKFLDSIRQNHLDRELQRKDEIREKRLECIEATANLWHQLWDFSSRAVFFNVGSKQESPLSRDRISYIENLTIEMENFVGLAEDVLNTWDHRFKGRLRQDEDPFLVFINTLFLSTQTIITCIMKNEKEEYIKLKQGLLQEIRVGIKSLAHHRLLNILKNNMRLLDLEEDELSNTKPLSYRERESLRQEKQQIQNKLFKDRKTMRYWADEFLNKELSHCCVLSFVKVDRKIRAFQESYSEMQQWVYNNPKEDLSKYEKFEEFKQLYADIPFSKRYYLIGPGGRSEEYMKNVAEWLSIQSICWEFVRPIENVTL